MAVSQAGSQESKPVLEASTHDVRPFANILRGISVSNSPRASITVLSAGLVILVEEARTLLAKAIVPRSIFETFEVDDTAQETLEIELNGLLTVLDIFGAVGSLPPSGVVSGGNQRGRKGGDGNAGDGGIERFFSTGSGKLTGMRLSYAGEGHPLCLTLSEDASGPVTTCNLNTLEPDPHYEQSFADEDKVVQVIMKSSWLAEALSELDTACEKLTILCSPPSVPLPRTSTTDRFTSANQSRQSLGKESLPTFRLYGTSAYGSTEIDYPNETDVLQKFECEEQTQFTYRFSHISRITRALQASTRTSLRMNEQGVLSLQLILPSVRVKGQDSQTPFIEFTCVALNDDV